MKASRKEMNQKLKMTAEKDAFLYKKINHLGIRKFMYMHKQNRQV